MRSMLLYMPLFCLKNCPTLSVFETVEPIVKYIKYEK